jgi:quercetin dioxygenase-like cupin family protein
MSVQRVSKVADHLQPNEGETIRSVVHATDDAAIVAWTVKPGQRISPRIYPSSQDTWTILEGEGEYQIDPAGRAEHIMAGDVVVAPAGAVHDVLNTGSQPLVFEYGVSPTLSGYEPLFSAPQTLTAPAR